MTISKLTIRTLTAAAAVLAMGSAQAAATMLTLPVNALVADSVQTFSQEALDNFDIFTIAVSPLGNTTQSATNPAQYSLPITSVSVGWDLKVQKGGASGSALNIVRTFRSGRQASIVLANFNIDYGTKQVYADATPKGGVTTKQLAVYNFNVLTPLAIKYVFPFSITMHEELNTLKFTPAAVDAIMAGLELNAVVRPVVEAQDNGTLTQDIALKFRAKAVSATPYTPAP